MGAPSEPLGASRSRHSSAGGGSSRQGRATPQVGVRVRAGLAIRSPPSCPGSACCSGPPQSGGGGSPSDFHPTEGIVNVHTSWSAPLGICDPPRSRQPMGAATPKSASKTHWPRVMGPRTWRCQNDGRRASEADADAGAEGASGEVSGAISSATDPPCSSGPIPDQLSPKSPVRATRSDERSRGQVSGGCPLLCQYRACPELIARNLPQGACWWMVALVAVLVTDDAELVMVSAVLDMFSDIARSGSPGDDPAMGCRTSRGSRGGTR